MLTRMVQPIAATEPPGPMEQSNLWLTPHAGLVTASHPPLGAFSTSEEQGAG
jgi:hypothetical protein